MSWASALAAHNSFQKPGVIAQNCVQSTCAWLASSLCSKWQQAATAWYTVLRASGPLPELFHSSAASRTNFCRPAGLVETPGGGCVVPVIRAAALA
jgi:hypothetical protein